MNVISTAISFPYSIHQSRSCYDSSQDPRNAERESISFNPTATGVDIPTQLFLRLLSWKSLLVSEFYIQVTELQDFEKKIEKISAIEDVFGMLSDFTSEQLTTFEMSTDRGPFFK